MTNAAWESLSNQAVAACGPGIGRAAASYHASVGSDAARAPGMRRNIGARALTRTAAMRSRRTTQCSSPSWSRTTPTPSLATTWPASQWLSTSTSTVDPASRARSSAVPIVYCIELMVPTSRS